MVAPGESARSRKIAAVRAIARSPGPASGVGWSEDGVHPRGEPELTLRDNIGALFDKLHVQVPPRRPGRSGHLRNDGAAQPLALIRSSSALKSGRPSMGSARLTPVAVIGIRRRPFDHCFDAH